MVDKVPSFKEGGAFWFTDLTTPDTFYVLPVLTALTFWITVEVSVIPLMFVKQFSYPYADSIMESEVSCQSTRFCHDGI